MRWHDVGLVLLAFLSETIGTISGFGSSTFFVPTAVFFETFQLVLVLTALLHVFGNISKLMLFRRGFDKALVVKLAVPSILLTGVGALLTNTLPTEVLKIFLGIVLIVLALGMLFKGTSPLPISSKTGIVLTGISGFFTGLVGTGGAIRGAALATLRLEINTFVFMSSAIDIGGDILRAGIYLRSGYMDWTQWHYLPLLGIAAILGARTGRYILSFFNQSQFERVVAVLVFFSGLALFI